jgi:hypothetical protein
VSCLPAQNGVGSAGRATEATSVFTEWSRLSGPLVAEPHRFKNRCHPAVGIGLILTYGNLFLTTPQTYQLVGGFSWGVDLTIATSVGRWSFV